MGSLVETLGWLASVNCRVDLVWIAVEVPAVTYLGEVARARHYPSGRALRCRCGTVLDLPCLFVFARGEVRLEEPP